MYNMKILPACLTHNSRVALVHVQIHSNIFPQLLEDDSAAGKTQRSEIAIVLVGDRLL
jgi:hypothetical protein